MLTKRQRDALLFIQHFQAAHGGECPSLRDIAFAVSGQRAASEGMRLVDGLEARGFVRRIRARHRAIEVIRPIPVAEVYKWCDETKMLKPLNG